jgi:CRP-like cAMP-binding protein
MSRSSSFSAEVSGGRNWRNPTLVAQGARVAVTKSGFSDPFTKPSFGGIDPNSIRNEILLALPPGERDTVFSNLEFLETKSYDLWNEMGEPIQYCYFVNSGMTSILNVMADGKGVEVGLTGKEGFVGLPLVVGLKTSATRAVVQISGSAFRLSAASLVRTLRTCPQLERKLNRYSQELAMQSTQVAACNRLHEVEQRLARWLLMSQDRIGGDVVPLTQEFLAHMLGTRRASVTVAAGILQKRALVKYSRGVVTILSRAGLEAAACECYEILTRQSRNWKNESDS